MTATDKDIDAITAAVQEKMRRGEFSNASQQLDAFLKKHPNQTDVLYMRAVCARYLKNYSEALGFLNDLKAIKPDYGRAYQEEGHIYRAINDMTKALNAYQRACAFNPSLDVSWRRQGEILAASGKPAEARQATAQSEWLAALAPAVRAAMNHIHEGRLLKAENLCRAHLIKNKQDVEAMRLLAEVGARFNVLDDAEFLLESAAEFAPDNVAVRIDYIKILRKRQKYEAALKEAKELYKRNPDDPVFQSHLAIENMHNNNYERAFELFDKVLEKIPGDPTTLTTRGHALKTFGRHDDAVKSYRSAFQSLPDYGEAYFGLANLKTYRFTDEEIDLMRSQEGKEQIGHSNRTHLCFSLGKALEDRGEYEDSFSYYERGNELKRVQSRYTADEMTAELQAQSDVCTAALFDAHKGHGHDAPDPIFIVGLPRAGSTLLEQILASHSQIDGTLELPNILALAHQLRRRQRITDKSQYPQILTELTAEQLQDFGEAFIEDTRVHRQDAPFFIDKMPNNFRHIGLIHLILPNAKIIDARRAPMSCCFSGFKQLFADGQEFTYGLDVVGRYYHDYVMLMRHWDQVLPGKVLRVQYEDVVDDVEAQVRRILDYLGLPFEQACVEFHKTERVVRTASSEQVRQPINTKGLEAWQPYEPWLDELKTALGPVLEDYRD